ncbi:hypothetical protein B0T25DRAFT_564238 [Lasiosphaeria hispida]|uniref:Uncharacterized protein n=1 Tax=Lasiosphaeria hispida TaxID=260671 RepID=A0AAJ0HQ04_9PEZI|nr:hypothetical protein B0T25DRAFT_564238 [Lasiosphaeria hispida]
MSANNLDTLLVDGNMQDASSDKISPLSLFCTNFALAITNLEPENVFTHFYCGLRTDGDDTWSGPNGLVRSIIAQLLRHLLHTLLHQFSAGTTIYSIIDGISTFDVDYRRAFAILEGRIMMMMIDSV